MSSAHISAFAKKSSGLCAALALLCAYSTAVHADDAVVKATFNVTLSGVGIGKGSFEATVTPQGYSIGVAAKITGIARLVAGGEGGATARGSYHGVNLSPMSYSIKNTVSDIQNSIQLSMQGNSVVGEAVSPATPPHPDRVPLTAASRKGIIDPLSALLIPVSGDPNDASSCDRTLRIYDGRQRYDIAMAYSRTEQMRGVGDFEGQSIVCKAAWRPIAGHRPERADVKYMEENRDVEVWLMPIQGTHFLVMSKIAIGTNVGKLVVSASRVSISSGRQATLRQ